MSKVLKQSKAVLVMALMYNDINIYNSALEKLINNFGDIEVISDEYLFSHSIYYKDEMGDSLNKRFIVFNKMIERDYISDVKKITDNIEKEYLDNNCNRKINIDPAILTLENFVLVTNKNFTHRIYLKEGVFADLTLLYKKKKGYTELPWTYADYSSEETKNFLNKIRELFYNRLIESSPFGYNWK